MLLYYPIGGFMELRDILRDNVDDKYYINTENLIVKDKGVKDSDLPLIGASRGRYFNGSTKTQQQLEINTLGYCNSLTTVASDNLVVEKIENELKVRKIMPLEAWLLMGYSEDDFNKASSVGLSDSKLYERAGRGIVVPMLESIFENLLHEYID